MAETISVEHLTTERRARTTKKTPKIDSFKKGPTSDAIELSNEPGVQMAVTISVEDFTDREKS
jgi:hypothetical protein